MPRRLGRLVGPALLSLTFACAPAPEPAGLVLRGGTVVTLDAAKPVAEALAARNGQIVAIGTAQEISRFIGPKTEVIELTGRTVTPGFIEGHGHFLGVGLMKMQLDLTKARSWDEIVAMVAEAAKSAKPGDWILGRGWHQEKWDRVPEPSFEGLPYHDSLSAVSPNNPVVLEHASGHAVFANAKAMELGGVTAATPDPPGGTIVRDGAGRMVGAVRETASALVERSSPPSESEVLRAIELATDDALGKGITSFQDAGSPVELVALYRRLADADDLRLRLWVMYRDSNDKLRAAIPKLAALPPNAFFKAGGIKHSIDGALGSHGAWLLEPYTDLPSSTGLNTTPVATIEESAAIALEHHLQLCVHAIGDRANRETLDLFERSLAKQPDGRDRRWRVEHAQHLNPAEFPRFAKLGVIASVQTVHCTSDGPWVPHRIGDHRAEEGAYVWRTLIESGARIANGTDAPVEDADPIPNFYAAVTRRMRDGKVFYGKQVLTREEALRSLTLDNAYAVFQENEKGSLAPGKLADLVVLSQDLLTVPEEKLLDTRVEVTIVGGKVAWRRE